MLILGFNMAMRVITTVLLPLLTIVIQLQGTEIILYIVVLAPFAFIGFFLWSKLESKIGLKKCFSISLLLVVILLFGSLILFAPIELSMLKIGGAVFIGIALTCLVGGLLFPTPLLSGIIDESARMNWNGTEKMGTKLSGAYFGINTFMVNIASSIANMILGVIFTGGNQSNTTLLILSLPVSGIFFFFAWFSLYRIHMRPIEINKQI
jgi:Na+/melibiose symporter-like transporter